MTFNHFCQLQATNLQLLRVFIIMYITIYLECGELHVKNFSTLFFREIFPPIRASNHIVWYILFYIFYWYFNSCKYDIFRSCKRKKNYVSSLLILSIQGYNNEQCFLTFPDLNLFPVMYLLLLYLLKLQMWNFSMVQKYMLATYITSSTQTIIMVLYLFFELHSSCVDSYTVFYSF